MRISDWSSDVCSSDLTVQGVAFDSREVTQGDLFIALQGEATDGHKFIDKAIAAGAARTPFDNPLHHPHVPVPDNPAPPHALRVPSPAPPPARLARVTSSSGQTGQPNPRFRPPAPRTPRPAAHPAQPK